MKKTSIAMLLAMLLAVLTLPAMGEMHLNVHSPEAWTLRPDIVRVTQVDTNRSDCLLVEAFGKVMLVDGGYSGYNDHVQAVLKAKGIMRFDWILNTHPHDDHIDGANVLLRNGWTADVFLSPFDKIQKDVHQQGCMKIVDKLGIPYVKINGSYSISLGGKPEMPEGQWVMMESLKQQSEWPLTLDIYSSGARDYNDGSALMILNYGESRMLFMADLTRGAQKVIMDNLPAEALKADIIKAPHHGITYFDTTFLSIADPALVTITNRAAKDNQIGSQCVKNGIPCIFSGSGDIIMETDGIDWYVWQLPEGTPL